MVNIHRRYLLALGGNLPSDAGTPLETLATAIKSLAATSCQLTAVSRFFATPCFPAGAGPDYVNAAIEVKSDLPPSYMLTLVHQIEQQFGRERQQRWGMRTLDIDLIACGDTVLPNIRIQQQWQHLASQNQLTETPAQLILPHPRLQDRAFVLAPLKDIASHWVHPLIGLSVEQMLAKLPKSDRNAVIAL